MEDMVKDLPPVAPTPCLQNGYITFGSFNQIGKLQKECVDLWCRVLQEVSLTSSAAPQRGAGPNFTCMLLHRERDARKAVVSDDKP